MLANNANTAVGHTTTFITFQDLSSTAAATISVQYYSLTTGSPLTTDSLSISANGQQAILPNIGSGNSAGGIVTSNQPLNVVVSEALNSGGSAYNVAASTASTLYSPLALNGQFGFTTTFIIFNAGGTSSTGTIQFYDETGVLASAANQTFTIPPHASQTFNQAGSALANNHAYWAKITGGGSDSLTAQVIEFGPANFVATFNALPAVQAATTLYAPATFNGQFNFVTGMGFANPNGTAATGSITYYDAAGHNLLSQPLSLPANGNVGVFQPNVSGLSNQVTSAVITSTQPLIMTVNERGPGTIAGTYVGIGSGSNNVALPVMANGFASFITGATVFNTSSTTAHVTFTYYQQNGTTIGTPQMVTIAPNASFLVYQGDAGQSLPSNYFGTAILTSDQPLLVTTNALQTGTGLFYTYTEPTK